MTREEKLYSMRGVELIKEAEKLGVTVSHKGNVLKESKASAIKKILAAEALTEEYKDVPEAFQPVIETGTEILQEVEESPVEEAETPAEEPKTKERKKRAKKEIPERDAAYSAIKLLFADTEFSIKEWEKIPNLIAIKAGNKTLAEIRLGIKQVTFNVKNEMGEALGRTFTLQKYFLPVTIKVPYDEVDAVIRAFFNQLMN